MKGGAFIAIGIAVGTAVGVATDNLALWLPVGITLGAGLMVTRAKKNSKDDTSER